MKLSYLKIIAPLFVLALLVLSPSYGYAETMDTDENLYFEIVNNEATTFIQHTTGLATANTEDTITFKMFCC